MNILCVYVTVDFRIEVFDIPIRFPKQALAYSGFDNCTPPLTFSDSADWPPGLGCFSESGFDLPGPRALTKRIHPPPTQYILIVFDVQMLLV